MRILQVAEDNFRTANKILADLELFKLWKDAGGEPILVGAAAYELIINPDIDLEIYTDQPDVLSGFKVLEHCARNPKVIKARYSNHLDDEDKGIYYRLDYKSDDDNVWKIDMWLLAHDHPGPCARDLVESLKASLTEQHRHSILTIKQQLQSEPDLNIPSIQVYEAVLDHQIRTLEELKDWCKSRAEQGLTFWKPQNSSE
ncbi:hypothetical protein M3231_27665 [Neobacillus mesonae]|nr:hypothetical protein [Neobacillus mesonae]